MNWKETLFILAALIAIVGFSHFNLSRRIDGIETRMGNKIDLLIDRFDQDRRAMTERIDRLYSTEDKK